MDLIPGVVLFIGAIATVFFLAWDTLQKRIRITKAESQQSSRPKPSNQQEQIRGLFKRG